MQLPREDEVEASFDLDRNETIKSLVRAKPGVFVATPAVGVVSLLALAGYTLTSDGPELPGAPILFLALTVATLFPGVIVLAWMRAIRPTHVRYRFSPDRVAVESSDGAFEGKWEAIAARAKELRHGFVFFDRNGMMRFVPHRAFASETDIARFREIARGPLTAREPRQAAKVVALWLALIVLSGAVYLLVQPGNG